MLVHSTEETTYILKMKTAKGLVSEGGRREECKGRRERENVGLFRT